MDREAVYKYALKTRMLSATIHVCPCVYDFTYSHYLLYIQQRPTAEPDWPFVCPVRLIRSWSWNRRTPRAAEGGTPSSTSSTSSSSSVPRCRAGAPTDSWRRPQPPMDTSSFCRPTVLYPSTQTNGASTCCLSLWWWPESAISFPVGRLESPVFSRNRKPLC